VSNSSLIQIIDGNPTVKGRVLSRHPEYKWLFSVTDVYKALELNIKGQAKKEGKDPDKHYISKQPSSWRNWISDSTVALSHEDLVESFKRAKNEKYIFEFLFGQEMTQDILGHTDTNSKVIIGSSDHSAWKAQVALIKSIKGQRDRVVQTLKGNRPGVPQGTYVAFNLIISYCTFLNKGFGQRVANFYSSALTGDVDKVLETAQRSTDKLEASYEMRRAKGTPERLENRKLNTDLIKACWMHDILPMSVQKGINVGTLGMTAGEYKRQTGIGEPLGDNLPWKTVLIRNAAVTMSAMRVAHSRIGSLTNKKGFDLGLDSGRIANLLAKYPGMDANTMEEALRSAEPA
jgi:hypothetical protein